MDQTPKEVIREHESTSADEGVACRDHGLLRVLGNVKKPHKVLIFRFFNQSLPCWLEAQRTTYMSGGTGLLGAVQDPEAAQWPGARPPPTACGAYGSAATHSGHVSYSHLSPHKMSPLKKVGMK